MGNKLGKLVRIKQRRSANAKPLRRLLWLLFGLALLVGAVLVCGSWAKANLKPRKLVIINTNMVSPEELLDATGISGADSYASLADKAANYNPASARWLKAVDSQLAWGATVVLDPTERLPLLRVVAGGVKYWLCDDGSLARMDVDNDHGGVFDRIRGMPRVELLEDPGAGPLALAELLLTTGGYCQALMPGIITTIRLTPEGELNLIEQGGLEIRLGPPVDLEQKLSALPKALRICEGDRDKLDYLDASNPRIFYENWTEPPK